MTTILHICDWYRPLGGAEKLMFDTLALLEDNGHKNVIVYNDTPDQQPAGTRPEYACKELQPYVPHFHPGRYLAQRRVRRFIKSIISKHKPDVCHIHNLQNPFLVKYLIKEIPCVRSLHDPRLYCFTEWRLLPDKSICPFPLGKECIKQKCLSPGFRVKSVHDKQAIWVVKNYKAHKKMPLMILESSAQIEWVLQNGYSAKQVAWLPNFTPLKPVKEVKNFLKKYFNPREKIVLSVGRASYEKGIHVLIQASKYIKTKCKIIIITAGPLLVRLKRQASKYKNRVRIIPGLSYEKTREYYAKSSVVVVPSVWLENFCLVGLEAYANMKPVIGSRIGGIQDWLKNNETGLFFEPGNAKDLASKIDEILTSPDRTKKMGYAGYERAAKYYNKELYLSRLLDIYKKGIKIFQKRI